MSEGMEPEFVLQQDARRGGIDRRTFLTRSLAASLGLAGVGAVASGGFEAAYAKGRPLTPTFYSWIPDLHPEVKEVNAKFPGIHYEIAPVQGFGIERFVAEAKYKQSTWDVYVGMTPFVEMSALVAAGVIEPWDKYIPKEVLDDIIPSIREECTIDGKLYSWPFLLDVTGMAWHSGLTTKAGLPDEAPVTWHEYLESATKVVKSGVAPYGCTFDSHGWRSLAPFAFSMSTNCFTKDGLFDFTSEPAIAALELMKKMMPLADPDVLLEGTTDAGVNGTPDEVAFAAQRVAYYCKYFNAPLRMAHYWPDPKLLHLSRLPKFVNGAGSTVFWTTGCALFTYGQNKEKAAEYIRALTYDMHLWKDSVAGTKTNHAGQLPSYKSIYAKWEAEKPAWLPSFVPMIREQLNIAKAIENNIYGLTQFVIGKPIWDTYLKGQEKNPKVAMEKVVAAVRAEMQKGYQGNHG